MLSLASGDPARREHAIRETEAAIEVARTLPYGYLVVHLGVGTDLLPAAGPNSRDAALSSLERLAESADRVGVRLAVELIPNEISQAQTLVELIEDDLELPDVGICLDFGHAHLAGDLVDAIETMSGLIVTTHVHDNRGTGDDHLVPFEGSLDWDAALIAAQKVGYDGVFMLELSGGAAPDEVLGRAQAACGRLEALNAW